MKNLIILCLFFFSCVDSDLVKESYTAQEQSMIDGINKIFKEVKTFNPASLKNDFIEATEGASPKVFIFGENHLAYRGLIQTLGAINSLAKDGDILLFEGSDRNSEGTTDCLFGQMVQIYYRLLYRKTLKSGFDYDPNTFQKFVTDNKLFDILRATSVRHRNKSVNYDFSGLKDVKCYFWDHEESVKANLVEVTRETIKKRNRSMVDSIKDWTKKGHRVFIITGYAHMPLGELLDHWSRQEKEIKDFKYSPQELENFYSFVKGLKHPRKESNAYLIRGTSSLLYKNLKDIPYTQFIHKRMLINPYGDF